MIIKCKKIISQTTKKELKNSPWLKLEREYVVLSCVIGPREGISIYIKTEHHDEPSFLSMDGFEMISQKIPSNWITTVEESYDRKVITMLPASWNYESFFEDIEDQKPKAIALYNQEVDKIYKEAGIQ